MELSHSPDPLWTIPVFHDTCQDIHNNIHHMWGIPFTDLTNLCGNQRLGWFLEAFQTMLLLLCHSFGDTWIMLYYPKTIYDYPMCNHCQGHISLNHILFQMFLHWRTYGRHSTKHTIPHSQHLINRYSWRMRSSMRTTPILAQIDSLHLYHAWSTWWSLQKSSEDKDVIHPHSWLRRVITYYLYLNNQTEWNESPYVQDCLSQWIKLHRV